MCAMGIVTDSEFESEKDNLNGKTRRDNPEPRIPELIESELVKSEKGRGKGNIEVPESLRKLIGIESIMNGRASALELGRDFGISPSSVSAYSNGATSTKSYNNKVNLDAINNARMRVSKKARRVMMKAIDNITDDKMIEAKIDTLSAVARNMSGIIKDMEPESDKSGQNELAKPQFIVYSPQVLTENHFEVIHAKD